MESRNLFAVMHEMPSALSDVTTVAEKPIDDNKTENGDAKFPISTEEMFANDDKHSKMEQCETEIPTPGGSNPSNGEASEPENKSKIERRRSSDRSELQNSENFRRSSRHDKDVQMLLEHRSNNKGLDLNSSNIIPSLRRSNRANKGVSREVFDPSHVPTNKGKEQVVFDSPKRKGKTDSFEEDEEMKEVEKRRQSEESLKSKADESEEDSDSESDDDDYNDPNKLWCICRKPHNERFMISCDVCEEWFHGDCVGVTMQRGKQMEKKGEEYVCPTCLKNKGKKGKHEGESGYESAKNKAGVNLKGYAHGKHGPNRSQKGPGLSPSKRKRIHEATGKSNRKSDGSAKHRKCIVSTCNNKAPVDSVYCSNVCILRHAKESLGEMAKAKQKAGRQSSTDDKRETKEERIIRKIKEATSKGKVAVYCRKTGKIFSNASAPLKEELNSFLKHNPSFQPLKHPKKNKSESNIKQKSPQEIHSKKSHSHKHLDLYGQDPDYKPDEQRQSNPYKPQHVPSDKPRKHKLEKQESHESKKLKHRKSLDDRRYSTEKSQAQKLTPHKRDSRSFSDEKTDSKREVTPQKEKEIRKNVQKTLSGILQNRSNSSEDLKMHLDSITRLANKIEESLYKLFGGVTSKYKNRYRSIMFNLKDEKNEGLWRKVILGEVTSSSIVKMTPEEMASKELAQWREHELTAELEMIHELEIAKKNFRPVSKITHKGEIAINEDFSDLTESHLDASHEKPSIAPKRIRRISANQPEISLDLPAMTNDTTSQHNSHLFDLNCRICTGQVKEEDAQLDDTSSKAVKRSTSIILSNEAQTTAENEQTDEEILRKISNFNKSQSLSLLVPSDIKKESDQDENLVPVSPQEDFTGEDDEKTLKRSTSEEESSGKEEKTKDPSSIMTAKLSREHYLWTGVISMPELSSFRTNAYTVSGNSRELINAIPIKLVLDGRIHPKVVWEYLAKVSTFANKEVCVIQFRASSEDDRVGYVSMLSYFSSRKRFGVVSNQNTQVIKDIYLVPLLESENVPHQLLPFKGPGIPKNHPSMLLGVIVRCIPETPRRKPSLETEPIIKHEEKPRKQTDIVKIDDDLNLSKTSLLDRNRLLTPPMAHFTQKIVDSPKNEEEEEYNPETANFGDLDDDDLTEQSSKNAPVEDDEAYDPEMLTFDDEPAAEEEEEDDAPYDPEDDAERLENTELKALQEKQAFLEKMKQELDMKKAELAKEEMSLQISSPPPPPKPISKPLVDPRIAKRLNSDNKTSNNNNSNTLPVPAGGESSPLQKIYSVLNMERSKST